jgi:hypothetical protein
MPAAVKGFPFFKGNLLPTDGQTCSSLCTVQTQNVSAALPRSQTASYIGGHHAIKAGGCAVGRRPRVSYLYPQENYYGGGVLCCVV